MNHVDKHMQSQYSVDFIVALENSHGIDSMGVHRQNKNQQRLHRGSQTPKTYTLLLNCETHL